MQDGYSLDKAAFLVIQAVVPVFYSFIVSG